MKLRRLRPAVFIALSIGIWSFSPILVTFAKADIPSRIIAATATFMAAISAFVAAAIFDRSAFSELRSILHQRQRLIRLVVLGTMAFVAYPATYFFALQHGNPVAANLLNYLWPIVAVIVFTLRFRRPFTVELALGVIFGFAGALLAFSATQEPTNTFLGGWKEALPYFCAFLAAIFYGIYSGFLRTESPASRPPSQVFADFLFMIGLGGFLFAPWVVIWGFAFEGHALSLRTILFVALYGIGMALAHFSWLQGVSRSSTETPFIAVYLVPVLSTLVLSLYLGKGSANLFAAMSLVLCGIYFALNRRAALPVMGVVLLGSITSLRISTMIQPYLLSLPAREEWRGLALNLLQLHSALFAILSGFILTSAIGRYNDLRQRIVAVFGSLSRFQSLPVGSNDLVETMRANVAAYVARMSLPESAGKVHSIEIGLSELSSFEDQHKNEPKILEALSEFRLSLVCLDASLRNGISTYEWSVISLTTILMLFLLHSIPWTGLGMQLATAATVAVIIGIVFAIRDYDLNRPHSLGAFLILSQSLEAQPVIPRVLVDSFHIPQKCVLRIVEEDGSIISPSGAPVRTWHARLTGFFFWIIILVSVLLGLSAIMFR